MANKITWDVVYSDFRARYPEMRKKVIDKRPHAFDEIDLWFEDGSIGVYNYSTKRVVFTTRRWLNRN